MNDTEQYRHQCEIRDLCRKTEERGLGWLQGHVEKWKRWEGIRQEFWQQKLARNAGRDAKVEARLLDTGWRVLTVWECALKGKGRITEAELATRARAWLEGSEPTGAIAGDYDLNN